MTHTAESDVQTALRLAASKRGDVLWRNNSGVLRNERGVPVRFGLCNDSEALNDVVKSSDLIGIRRVVVTPEMVGTVVGVFYAREVKHGGWRYTGTPRERAQLRFIEIVREAGGDAAFAVSVDDL